MYASLTILIAQGDSRLESFSSGFRKDRAQFDSGDVVLFLASLAVVFTVLWLLARWSERRVRSDSSLALFWTLAKAHGISWADRWMLWRIARNKGVAEPALLFLEPRLTSPQTMQRLAPQPAARLKALRRQFFFGIDRADDVPGDTSSDTPLDASAVSTGLPSPTPTAMFPMGETPSELEAPLARTGGLAEALNTMRALSLQDQPVRNQEPVAETTPDQTDEPSTRTAEFPASEAPVLDLYPWLGSDWEITNADE